MYTREGTLTVHGTAIVRVEPDLVAIAFAVSRTASTPTDAFASVREATGSVRTFLTGAAGCQIRSSRMRLHQELPRGPFDPRQLGNVAGYVATASFSLVTSDLEAVEGLLSGVVSAGANQLTSVEFLDFEAKGRQGRGEDNGGVSGQRKSTPLLRGGKC